MPLPWPDSLLPEAADRGLRRRPWPPAPSAGSSAARWRGRCSRPAPGAPGRGGHRAALAGLLALVAVIAWGLPISSDGPASATVRLTDVPSSDGRSVQATIRVTPRGRPRRRPLRERHRLAGRRQRGQRPEADRPRPLPHHRADPGPRRLEGDGARAHRQARWSPCRSTCRATAPSRRRRCRPGRASRARSCATSRSSSASRRSGVPGVLKLIAYLTVARDRRRPDRADRLGAAAARGRRAAEQAAAGARRRSPARPPNWCRYARTQ